MDFQAFADRLPMVYGKGAMIYHQGDSPTRFYYLRQGRVRLYLSSATGNERTLMEIHAGELFGEAAFFDHLPRVSAAKAVEKSQIVPIDQGLLQSLLQSDPILSMELLAYLAKRVRTLSAQVDSMTFLSADCRLAQLLLQLAEEDGTVRQTHEALANLSGVSRVTVSKILSGFVKKEWIATGYRTLSVQNRTALVGFVDSF